VAILATCAKECLHNQRRGLGEEAPLDRAERGDPAEGLLPGDDHVGRHIGHHRRLEELPPRPHVDQLAARLPPVTTLAPFLTASAMCASTFATAFMSISGPITAPGSNPSATYIAPAVSASPPLPPPQAGEGWVRGHRPPSCTRMRLAHTQVWPAFRYFEAIPRQSVV